MCLLTRDRVQTTRYIPSTKQIGKKKDLFDGFISVNFCEKVKEQKNCLGELGKLSFGVVFKV